jgi:hypothetical protein
MPLNTEFEPVDPVLLPAPPAPIVTVNEAPGE